MSGISHAARQLLPSRVRAPLARLRAFPRAYLLGTRVSHAYSRHYAEAQRRYLADGHIPDPERPSLSAIGVRTLIPGERSNFMALPSNYGELLGRVQRTLSERLSWSANSWFHPPPARLAARTDDVEEVRRGDVITLKLRNHLDIDGLEDLSAALIPAVEQAVYGSYVLVDKVYVQRTFASPRRERGSWLWHFDQHPVEVVKLMIYLTDVDEGTAPFTYLASPSGAAVMGSGHPLWGESRIPAEAIDAHTRRGCRVVAVKQYVGGAL